MTHSEMVRTGTRLLEEAGIPAAAYEARELYLRTAGLSLSDYALCRTEEAEAETALRYEERIRRRSDREPLQYITGFAPFYGRDFRVGPGVLIPRFDTETLVSAVLPKLKEGMRILDLCTGSGCVLMTLIMEGPEGLIGTGTDISDEALRYAGLNRDRFGLGVDLLKSDLFESVSGRYDLITANPPYIRTGEIAALDREVRDYEPHLALDGDADGLRFYRRICSLAGQFLKDDGWLAFETGYDEAEDVGKLMKDAGFAGIRVFRDEAGLERAVIGERHV